MKDREDENSRLAQSIKKTQKESEISAIRASELDQELEEAGQVNATLREEIKELNNRFYEMTARAKESRNSKTGEPKATTSRSSGRQVLIERTLVVLLSSDT